MAGRSLAKAVAGPGTLRHDWHLMRHPVRTLRRLILLTALTVALVATAFAHRMPSGDDTALQAFVLAGGDLADLCTDPDGDGPAAAVHCPACQIAGAVYLPPASLGLRDADLIFVAAVVAPRESRAVRAVLDPARGMRAPPLA